MRPFMIEFSGCAEAGKTTCIKTLLKRFTDCGLKVGYIRETAEIIHGKFPKNSFDYSLYTRLTPINKIMEFKYDPKKYDLILIDRGIIDGIFFSMHLLTMEPNLYDSYSQLIIFLNSLKELFPDYLLIFKVSPDTSILRRGGEGSLVTYDFIKQQNILLDSFSKSIDIPHTIIDTSNMSKEYVAKSVFNLILAQFSRRH